MGLFNKKTQNKKDSDSASEPSMKDLYSSGDSKKVVKSVKKSSVKKVDKDKTSKDVSSVISVKDKKHGNAYRILVKPLITEKISGLVELNKYAFEVSLNANKIEVAKAVRELYGVSVKKVNIIKMKGKKVRYGKVSGKRKDWKKAIITLSKGESINIYEGI